MHIAHFDNIIVLPLSLPEIFGSIFSVYFQHFKQYDSILYICIACKIIQNYIVIFLKLFGEKRFVYSIKVFLLNIKLVNPIQKHPHIIESYACILKIFTITFLLSEAEDEGRSINFIISLGICSTSKESK